MKEKDRVPLLAASAFIVTGGLGSFASAEPSDDDIFSLEEIHVMQPCYWLSREIPAEGLCGEKMRPDLEVLIQEAEKGNSIAAMRLGQLYGSGNWGINQDLTKSVKWYTHAAELGDRQSQIRLGQAYEFGRLGVQTDTRSAIRFYMMATENGIYPDLEEKIEKLEKTLSKGK